MGRVWAWRSAAAWPNRWAARLTATSSGIAGEGSVFRLSLPVQVTTLPDAVPMPEPRSLRGCRVLVVDDNSTNRRILTTLLQRWEVEAAATASPLEAIEWVRAGQGFDVAVLDLLMPERDGIELAGDLRDLRPEAPIPVVILSSIGQHAGTAPNVRAMLVKPVKPSALHDALSTAVSGEEVVSRADRGTSATPVAGTTAGLRILLAEDNAVNQKLAIRLLERMGHDGPTVVEDGQEVIDALETAEFDVILMDVQMPRLDGLEATRRVRERWPERAIRIVGLTANAMAGDREACLAAGMDDYVSKPIRPDELARAIAATGASPISRPGRWSGGASRVMNEHEPSAPAAALDRDTLTGRVLVVDDTPFNRQLLTRLLGKIGHVSVEAGDGRAALAILRDPATEPIDLILLDIVMPEMDGYETLAALKSDDALRDIPVIVISGVDELDSVVRCIEMGAADYLPKTVDPAILRARIAASLGQKRLRDQERALLGTIDRQRSQLARFLSPQVAALVSSPDGEAMLAGHRREITAMFCDLRNFTVFSETAEPEEVLGFLRLYHATLGALVVAHEGTLEHFAGDGIMVFFNDPVLQADHAQRSVQLALDIRERFKDIAAEWRRRGHVLEVGIGIATGYATMGRIGFEGRYDYGGVGNAIILASRLSGEAVAGQILMAARTYAAIDEALAEPVGERQLKGFSRPMPVYAAGSASGAESAAEG